MVKKENIKVAILAGGLGTRIRKISGDSPKAMLDVNGNPFLLDRIDFLKKEGFKKIVLLVGYKSEKIKDFFGNGKDFGIEIEYSEEKEPLGTGGAVFNAIDMLGDVFFVINGDTSIDINLNKMFDYHLSKGSDATIALACCEKASKQKGNCFYDFSKKIAGFCEKNDRVFYKDYNLGINTGVYIFKSKVFRNFNSRNFSLEEDLIPSFIKEKRFKLYSYVMNSQIMDIGTISGYEEFIKYKIESGITKRHTIKTIMNTLKISVIIPSYNPDKEKITECIEAINSSSLKPFEIILVDDCSTIDYPDEIRPYCIIIRNQKKSGPAFARNEGAKVAKGDILCFIDVDVKIKHDTLAKISEKFYDRNITAIQTLYSKYTDIQNFSTQYQNLYQHYNFKIINSTYLATLSSYCIAIRKKEFFAVGGFDHNIPNAAWEDEHLGLELYDRGYKILLAKDIIVEHLHYFNFKKLLYRMYMMGRDKVECIVLNPQIIKMPLSKTYHPKNLTISILISPLILLLAMIVMLPFVWVGILLLILIFSLVNFDFFIFIYKNKGSWFTFKSIITYYLVCLSIFLGFMRGGLNVILNKKAWSIIK